MSFDPGPAVLIAGYGAAYGIRWRRVRAAHGARGAPVSRALAFAGALCLLAVAFYSPVDALSEDLATFHMVQHLLLADLAPILLILALTKIILRPVTRVVHRVEQAAGPLAHPVFGVVAYVGVMWFWHVPALYDAALESAWVHALQHLTYTAAGSLYWWHLLSPIRSRLRLGGLGPLMYMASTKLLVGALGIVLAFAPDLLWHGYGETGERLGMSPLTDQHVAGLVMGLEQGIVMGIALAWLFARLLAEADRDDERADRYEEASA